MDAEQPRTPIEPASGQVPNAGQLEQWAREGEQWVAEAGRYDTMLQPFGEAVLAAAGLSPGERVADVGCGNRALTIDADPSSRLICDATQNYLFGSCPRTMSSISGIQ